MNKLLDLVTFAFVALLTFMLFYYFEGWKAYGAVVVLWVFYIASYIDDSGTS